MDVKAKLMAFIVEKVRTTTSPDRPYFYVRGSGIKELVESYNLDLLKLIDEMVKKRMIKKGLVRKRLVLYIYQPVNKKRLESVKQEFEKFLNK